MRSLFFMAVTFWASGALAADKLTIGPPPSWVKPVAIRGDVKPDSAPVKVLLVDQQVDLQPGRQTHYGETATRIQTPEGLDAANISFSWDPAIQSVTVNKLQIRRGEQVIDVLAGGQSFAVVRRERNLEYATIDGVLTATMQPEGLQVGDIIDLALTVTESDPALGRHVEAVVAPWNELAIARAHARVQWPSSVPMRMRPTGGLPLPKLVKQDRMSSIELAQDNVEPLPLPKDAPHRYQLGRRLELTDFPNWSDLAGLFTPLYVKAAVAAPNGPLHAEIDKISAATADPVARAEAALALVQDRVRYVALVLNNGGLIPADADVTWSRRFGDCKAKSALLLAILHGLGIKAEAMIVDVQGDGLDQRLPMVTGFDHVIVRATIAGRDYWLDGTRLGDRHLAGIETPNFHWGLPLAPGAKLVALVPSPRTQPDTELTVRIDASKGLSLPATIHAEHLFRGDPAIASNNVINNQSGNERDRYLRDYFKGQYDALEVKTATASFDPDKRELRMLLDGTIAMDWSNGWYRVDGAAIGYKADFRRDPGPDSGAPFAIDYPAYSHLDETILLPPNAGAFAVYRKTTDVDETIAGVAYHRAVKLEGNRFSVDESERSIAPEFPVSQAAQAQARLRELDNQPVALYRPTNYLETHDELAVTQAKQPANSADYVRRGNAYGNDHQYDLAIADFTTALKLDPGNAEALAGRAFAYFVGEQLPLAERDADASLKIRPNENLALRVKAMAALKAGRVDEAVSTFDALIQANPNDSVALADRALAEERKHEQAKAMADANAALKIDPNLPLVYLLRARLYFRAGDLAAGQKEADAAVAAAPDDPMILAAAGKGFAALGVRGKAMVLFDKVLKLKPEATIYLDRSSAREPDDFAGRQADIDAALKLEPKLAEAWFNQAYLYEEQKQWPAMLSTMTKLIEFEPSAPAYATRAEAYAHLGDASHAAADLTTARVKAKTAGELNRVCWTKAITGVLLDSALGDCDSALTLAPNAADIVDSRAFVLLKLQRNDEAIAAYDRALTLSPKLAPSLFGRAIAEARKGDKTASDRDVAAALAIAPHVRDDFLGYGVKVDQPVTAVAATPARAAKVVPHP